MPTVTIAASPIAGDIVCELSELRGQKSSVAPVKDSTRRAQSRRSPKAPIQRDPDTACADSAAKSREISVTSPLVSFRKE